MLSNPNEAPESRVPAVMVGSRRAINSLIGIERGIM
jgi:hypothetical protein